MSIERIASLDDPRLLHYRDLRQKSHTRSPGHFVAEGWRVVERMLQSGIEVESVLVSARREELMIPRFADRAPLFVIPEELGRELVGYNFHAGVLGVGRRPANPELSHLLQTRRGAPLIVACPHLTGPDNLGSLIRLMAGLGGSGILLGSESADPYLRRCVRVSMGTIFQIPVRVTTDLATELIQLRDVWQVRLLAAERTATSVPLNRTDPRLRADQPRLLLLGNEAEGLHEHWLKLCEQTYHIPMVEGVDSLNLAQAAGIFLYELTLPE